MLRNLLKSDNTLQFKTHDFLASRYLSMPVISMFYGVIVLMYYFDNRQHLMPHIHVRYGEEEAVVQIPDGTLIEGGLHRSKMKLLQAWIEIHRDELMANWELAVNGQQVFQIEPLK